MYCASWIPLAPTPHPIVERQRHIHWAVSHSTERFGADASHDAYLRMVERYAHLPDAEWTSRFPTLEHLKRCAYIVARHCWARSRARGTREVSESDLHHAASWPSLEPSHGGRQLEIVALRDALHRLWHASSPPHKRTLLLLTLHEVHGLSTKALTRRGTVRVALASDQVRETFLIVFGTERPWEGLHGARRPPSSVLWSEGTVANAFVLGRQLLRAARGDPAG